MPSQTANPPPAHQPTQAPVPNLSTPQPSQNWQKPIVRGPVRVEPIHGHGGQQPTVRLPTEFKKVDNYQFKFNQHVKKEHFLPKRACECGCMRSVAFGKSARISWTTCCVECTKSNGKTHSARCDQRYLAFKCKCCDRLINYSTLTDSGNKGDTCCRGCATAWFSWFKVHDDDCYKRNNLEISTWDKYKNWVLPVVAGT